MERARDRMMATRYSSLPIKLAPTRAPVRTPRNGKRMTRIRRGNCWGSLPTSFVKRRIRRTTRGITPPHRLVTRWPSHTKTHQRCRGRFRRTIRSRLLHPRPALRSPSRRSTMQSPLFCVLFLEQRRAVLLHRRSLGRLGWPSSRLQRTRN